jgi:hypothetical protein
MDDEAAPLGAAFFVRPAGRGTIETLTRRFVYLAVFVKHITVMAEFNSTSI